MKVSIVEIRYEDTYPHCGVISEFDKGRVPTTGQVVHCESCGNTYHLEVL